MASSDELAKSPAAGSPGSGAPAAAGKDLAPNGAGPRRLVARAKAIAQGGAAAGAKQRGKAKEAGAAGVDPGAAQAGLFTEDNTRRLVALPFRLAAIGTDFDGWELVEREEKELAASAVPALNHFVAIEPKYVALSLFSLSLVGLVSAKAVEYAGWKRARAIAEAEAAAARKEGGHAGA